MTLPCALSSVTETQPLHPLLFLLLQERRREEEILSSSLVDEQRIGERVNILEYFAPFFESKKIFFYQKWYGKYYKNDSGKSIMKFVCLFTLKWKYFLAN